MSNFMGFSEPEENWSKLPHEFIGSMGAIASLAEMKVVLYVLRHTWGYHDRQGIRETEKRISLDEFCHGRKLKGGERMDAGTGMSLNAVKDGIKRAIEDGYITIAGKDESDKARVKTWYALAMRVSEVDTHLSKVDTQPSEVDPRSKKDTLERNLEKDGDSKIESPSPEEKEADELYNAMPSQSAGMVRQEHTAATASPVLAERQFVREYAPVFALICQRAKPITEDRQAARRAFGKHFDVAKMNERLTAYQNGDGGEFRKPDATAFWIVNRLEKDLAQRVVVRESWDSIPRFHAED